MLNYQISPIASNQRLFTDSPVIPNQYQMMTTFQLNQSMPTYPYYNNMYWYSNSIQSNKDVNHYSKYMNNK